MQLTIVLTGRGMMAKVWGLLVLGLTTLLLVLIMDTNVRLLSLSRRDEIISNIQAAAEMEKVAVHHVDSNVTSWCVIGARESATHAARMYPDHFPHMAENLLPCWSWFRSQNATSSCGLVLLDGMKLKKEGKPGWISQLVDYMGCRVIMFDSNIKDRLRPLGPSEFIQHTIFPVWKRSRPNTMRYLADPEDAQELRRLIVSDDWIAENRQPDKLHFGIIQRSGNTRVFQDLPLLVDTVRDNFPDAVLNVTTLNTTSLKEQAQWFALQDVVLACHGAALTNSIFLRRQSIVLQFFPDGFFWQSLDPLIEQAGSIALFWYPDDQPHMESNYRKKLIANKRNITIGNRDGKINKDKLIRPIQEALYSIGKMAPSGEKTEGGYYRVG